MSSVTRGRQEPVQVGGVLKGSLGNYNNHVCVVVDPSVNAQPDERLSLGTQAVVCDGWLDLVAGPSAYFRVLDSLQCEFEPDTIAALTDLVT